MFNALQPIRDLARPPFHAPLTHLPIGTRRDRTARVLARVGACLTCLIRRRGCGWPLCAPSHPSPSGAYLAIALYGGSASLIGFCLILLAPLVTLRPQHLPRHASHQPPLCRMLGETPPHESLEERMGERRLGIGEVRLEQGRGWGGGKVQGQWRRLDSRTLPHLSEDNCVQVLNQRSWLDVDIENVFGIRMPSRRSDEEETLGWRISLAKEGTSGRSPAQAKSIYVGLGWMPSSSPTPLPCNVRLASDDHIEPCCYRLTLLDATPNRL
ncbi:hypothetical protein FA13DRAFT_1712391 [Coprinellus micaceus]|uniref:Uncharacterized protein n=1 Tax=Coprinellus micaceus TaxID=71717 RepID=A0A4Y7T0L6_COPMI|nr:hypothetical protein FA13DRAFT_1712391 [Coprinellus micaceus]